MIVNLSFAMPRNILTQIEEYMRHDRSDLPTGKEFGPNTFNTKRHVIPVRELGEQQLAVQMSLMKPGVGHDTDALSHCTVFLYDADLAKELDLCLAPCKRFKMRGIYNCKFSPKLTVRVTVVPHDDGPDYKLSILTVEK
jgi:hypothetical protein